MVFLKMQNIDVYVTGSNAKFLSKDIITEFRGRGYEVKMFPLCFYEYMSAYKGSIQAGLNEYICYMVDCLNSIMYYRRQKVKF